MDSKVRTQLRPEDTLHARAAKGGMVSGVSFALNMGLNLIQVPLLLHFWPQETYGLWLSIGAVAGLLTSLDGGHQAYVGNLFSRYCVEDQVLFRRTLASAVRVAVLTSTLQIVATLALCFSGSAAHWLDIAPLRSADFSLAVAIFTVGGIATGSVGAILVRLFLPTGYFVRSIWWAIAARFIQFTAVILSAWFGWGLVGTAILVACAIFIYNLCLFADIYRLFPELFPWWRSGDFRHGFGNFLRSNTLAGISLLDQLSLQGVILLVTGTIGAAVVPLFTALRTLSNTAMQGTGFLMNPIQADLVRYHLRNEGDKIVAVFSFYWVTTGVAINGGVVAGLFFVEDIFNFWTRGRLVFDRTLFGWLTAAILVRTIAAPLQSYLSSINDLKALTVTSVVRAASTVGGVLALAPISGLAGVGAALFAAELLGSLVLPWWFAGRLIERLGYRLGWSVPGVALLSTIIAGVAVVGYASRQIGWSWLVGFSLAALLGVTWVQWRRLPLEVKRRAFAVVPVGLVFFRAKVQ